MPEGSSVIVQLSELGVHELVSISQLRALTVSDRMTGSYVVETRVAQVVKGFATVVGVQEGCPERRVVYGVPCGNGEDAISSIGAGRQRIKALPGSMIILIDGHDGTMRKTGGILSLGGGGDRGAWRYCNVSHVIVPAERVAVGPVDAWGTTAAVLLMRYSSRCNHMALTSGKGRLARARGAGRVL